MIVMPVRRSTSLLLFLFPGGSFSRAVWGMKNVERDVIGLRGKVLRKEAVVTGRGGSSQEHFSDSRSTLHLIHECVYLTFSQALSFPLQSRHLSFLARNRSIT